MFEWLFPNWSSPPAVAALVGARVLLNVYLTATVSETVGRRTVYAVTVGVATLVSGLLTVLLLRPGGISHELSYVESLVQVLLIGIAGYVSYSSRWEGHRSLTVFAIIGATAFSVVMIPVYGERFVAP